MLEYRAQKVAATTSAVDGLAMLACVSSSAYPAREILEISNGKAVRAGVIDTSSQLLNIALTSDVYKDFSVEMLASAAEAFNASMLEQSDSLGAEFSKVLEDNLWDLLIR